MVHNVIDSYGSQISKPKSSKDGLQTMFVNPSLDGSNFTPLAFSRSELIRFSFQSGTLRAFTFDDFCCRSASLFYASGEQVLLHAHSVSKPFP